MLLSFFICITIGELFWKYGEARGGTPSLLIDTPYGPRYVAFFHSQCKCALPSILTYYFGAYLFNAEPPFEITHMTPEPIIPEVDSFSVLL
jgi:hypothetical protein